MLLSLTNLFLSLEISTDFAFYSFNRRLAPLLLFVGTLLDPSDSLADYLRFLVLRHLVLNVPVALAG